jgi:hypothetical protein
MSNIQDMPRSMRRAAQKHLQQQNAKWPVQLKEWPRQDWPEDNPRVLRCLRSRGFLVQEYPASKPAIVRLSINRASITTGGDWNQEITWVELQRLKREAGYGDCDAVEIFPPDADVVNVANMRHLWVLPANTLTFAWRKSA